MYIKRKIDKNLQDWKQSASRKPLLLRGARQVGKSSSVREFGRQFEHFVEINFDKKDSEAAKLVFDKTSSPQQICDELSLIYGKPIIPNRTLLFLDEIQSCVAAISSLRYFYEDMPELHVVAAGSLLEFALEEVPSYGVGRIRSLFMYPLCFDEFLRATNHSLLADAVQKSTPDSPPSEAIHHTCLQQLVRFMLVGGMPQVVATLVQGGSLQDCRQVLDDLILTFDDDFAKYKARVPSSRLREVFLSAMEQAGGKFVYSRASQTAKHEHIKEAVSLLAMAGLVYPVTHTSANGIPLAAQLNHKIRKYVVFDTGVMQRCLQLDISDILLGDTLSQINKGALAELFAGLEIIKAMPCHQPAQLYYWQREHHGSQAEIDYVVQREREIIPLEVKAGTKGAMQSLHLFMEEKNSVRGIRASLENFGKVGNVDIYPLYTVANAINN
jgi:predicted AAA+ superfamily ATPase